MKNKILVGALELCDLPDLNICGLETRIDTGAKTSSLHVDNIREFEQDGQPWIEFDIHPDVHQVERVVKRTAQVKAQRKIKSSTGHTEARYVIHTRIHLADQEWDIEVTLTDRSGMTYLMLLGREAMAGRILVDPSETFLQGQ